MLRLNVIVAVTCFVIINHIFPISGSKNRRQSQWQRDDITSIVPSFGPSSARTQVTVHGNFENIIIKSIFIIKKTPSYMVEFKHPNQTKFTNLLLTMPPLVGDDLPKYVNIKFAITFDMLWDFTDRSKRYMVDPAVWEKWHNGYRVRGPTYTYKYDPFITKVFPKTSFLGGGINITITGEHFDSIYDPPTMHFIMEKRQITLRTYSEIDIFNSDHAVYTSSCTIRVGSEMIVAKSPNINEPSMTLNSASDYINNYPFVNIFQFFIGLNFKGINWFHNISQKMKTAKEGIIIMAQNPVFTKFNKPIIFNNTESNITLSGTRLALASVKPDYTVRINNSLSCIVVDLTNESITCQPPKLDQSETNESEFDITIEVGYITEVVGVLRYNYIKSVRPRQDTSLLVLAIAIPIGAVVVYQLIGILIILICCCVWKSKRRPNTTPDVANQASSLPQQQDQSADPVPLSPDSSQQATPMVCQSAYDAPSTSSGTSSQQQIQHDSLPTSNDEDPQPNIFAGIPFIDEFEDGQGEEIELQDMTVADGDFSKPLIP